MMVNIDDDIDNNVDDDIDDEIIPYVPEFGDASGSSFKYYKSPINADATYLYKRYDEKLLIAIAFDANNELFPLAFAIVDEENNSKWRWLLLCLQRYVISDRTYPTTKKDLMKMPYEPSKHKFDCGMKEYVAYRLLMLSVYIWMMIFLDNMIISRESMTIIMKSIFHDTCLLNPPTLLSYGYKINIDRMMYLPVL
uniref:MULE transposase domain-containing protein n=1 Tax=Populus trichocarpa TaxID=3694 RepID=A0A2K1XE69_POPTR